MAIIWSDAMFFGSSVGGDGVGVGVVDVVVDDEDSAIRNGTEIAFKVTSFGVFLCDRNLRKHVPDRIDNPLISYETPSYVFFPLTVA